MNLHPLIVHFPIALLVLYTLLELISLCSAKFAQKFYTTKLMCLWLGTLGSFFALQSGELAQDLLGRSELIHTHEEFAEKSHLIYLAISIYYLILSVLQYRSSSSAGLAILQHWITRLMLVVLGIVGFVILTIVGALGGAITRGTEHDLISRWAVQTFVSDSPASSRGQDKDEESDLGSMKYKDNQEDLQVPEDTTHTTNTYNTGMSYTMDQVKDHDSPSSCWIVIHDQIYDVTAFINKHPGGDRNILKLCGKDATEMFEKKHGGQEKPQMTLEDFAIAFLRS